MKTDHPKTILAWVAVLIAMSSIAFGTVVIPEEGRFSWSYTLLGGSGGTDTPDHFAIQFGDDRLSSGESLLVTVIPSGQSVPSWTRTINGFGAGLNGSLYFGEIDAYFPTRDGTVMFEILSGSVNLERITIILNTPSDRASTSISPNLTLIPEPGTASLVVCGLVMLAILRRT